jgi:hypothetical protein
MCSSTRVLLVLVARVVLLLLENHVRTVLYSCSTVLEYSVSTLNGTLMLQVQVRVIHVRQKTFIGSILLEYSSSRVLVRTPVQFQFHTLRT